MYQAMDDYGNFILKLAGVLVIALIIWFVISPYLNPTPIIEVKDCTLTSDTVPNNGITTITITLKNNHKDNAYTIKIEFSSHSLVTFMLGSQELPKENGVWYFEDTLNPGATHTQEIKVKASLENGIAKIAYRITLNFYREGQHFYGKNFDLNVQR